MVRDRQCAILVDEFLKTGFHEPLPRDLSHSIQYAAITDTPARELNIDHPVAKICKFTHATRPSKMSLHKPIRTDETGSSHRLNRIPAERGEAAPVPPR